MDMTRNDLKTLLAAAWLAAVVPALAATNSVPHVYPGGVQAASTLGNALYSALDPRFQGGLHPNPVTVENMEAPVITPIALHDGNQRLGEVFVSTGYIDLLNHLAHAKAIDRIQPGYFQQYILNLSRDMGGDAPPKAPTIIDNRYWTDEIMTLQEGYFNQIIGMTMALNLSHHYLGHYSKFSGRMLAGKLVPINSLLAPVEWDASVKAATLNALNCALGTDAPAALFDAIGKMPKRPAWTAFIVPPTADLKGLSKQLKVDEIAFFQGKLN